MFHGRSRTMQIGKAFQYMIVLGKQLYARGWMNLGSLLLGIRHSFKVNAVSHVPDALLILLIRQYMPSTSRLPLDWWRHVKWQKNEPSWRLPPVNIILYLTKRAVSSFLKSYPCWCYGCCSTRLFLAVSCVGLWVWHVGHTRLLFRILSMVYTVFIYICDRSLSNAS